MPSTGSAQVGAVEQLFRRGWNQARDRMRGCSWRRERRERGSERERERERKRERERAEREKAREKERDEAEERNLEREKEAETWGAWSVNAVSMA
eukprot:2319535-Rhodomonas_salina.1